MAFDQTTRNRLQRFVNDARRVLEEEFTRQLQNDYGMDPNAGAVTDLASLRHINDAQRETARIVRDTLAHYTASGDMNAAQGLDRIVREQAFTVLNRLAALRMAEARGLLVESVGNGFQAKGFQLYARLAGTGLGETGDAYRVYLFSVFDELAQDLPGLFDRYSPQGRLFPREAALLQVLNLINDADIAPLWGQDETIGWIYQYFNSKEERKAMREASQAPRNSRELAVRNQFFTPRYVVEFLVDNTLGRLWYEATQGTTTLRNRCQYLLCTPQDVFLRRFDTDDLRPGSVAALAQAGRWSDLPTFDTTEAGVQAMIEFAHCVNTYDRYSNATWGDYFQRLEPALREQRFADLSTQELWDGIFLVCRADRHGGDGSVYQERWFVATCQEIVERLKSDEPQRKGKVIAHHPVRDPRTLKLLDPACGSMHFGLYAFDLFAEIYREAWAWEQQHGPGSLQVPADVARTAEYASKTALAQSGKARAAIDTEASKAASGAYAPLCQAYTDEAALLRDVPRLIIEHNIYGVDIDPRAAQIASLALWLRAQRAWHDAGVKAKDRPLIGRGHVVAAIAPPAELELREQFAATLDHLDAVLFEKTLQLLKGLPELGVLLQVERELPHLIRQVFGEHGSLFKEADMEQWQKAEARLGVALTEFAQAAQSTYQGRLFAQDALQGLRLIDLCREVFDVVVMNPPFGEAAQSTIEYVKQSYPDWANNILCCFVSRALQLLRPAGYIGAIFDRTIAVKSSYENFRRNILIPNLSTFLDTGWGVLDANVETACACFTRNLQQSAYFIDIRQTEEKEVAVRESASKWRNGNGNDRSLTVLNPSALGHLPNAVVGYDFDDFAIDLFDQRSSFAHVGMQARQGHALVSDVHFRLFWEVDESACGKPKGHALLYNGSEFSLYVSPERDIVVRGYDTDFLQSHPSCVLRNPGFQFSPGISYGKRGEVLDAHLLESGHIFTSEGQAIHLEDRRKVYLGLACLNSSVYQYLINLYCGQHKHAGYINLLPAVPFSEGDENLIVECVEKIVALKNKWLSFDETTIKYRGCFVKQISLIKDIDLVFNCLKSEYLRDREALYKLEKTVDERIIDCAKLNEKERLKLIQWVHGTRPDDPLWPGLDKENQVGLTEAFLASSVISEILGLLFGRWLAPEHSSAAEAVEITNADSNVQFYPPVFDRRVGGGHPVKGRSWLPKDIFVDDSSDSSDLESCLGQLLESLCSDTAGAVEAALLRRFKEKTIREYLSSPSGFFADHLKRYTKSRREAPIFWPLTTASGEYTLWVYYPSLTSQTLYTAINDFVEPKLRQVGAEVTALRNKASARMRDDEKQFEALQAFELELIELRDNLLKLAPTYKPHHDDGVQISAAPLWALFRHKPWQKVLKDTWAKLEKGDYDWAHLAMNYWPERVREKCKTDKSLAIAHGLDDLYIEPEAKPKKLRDRKKSGESQ